MQPYRSSKYSRVQHCLIMNVCIHADLNPLLSMWEHRMKPISIRRCHIHRVALHSITRSLIFSLSLPLSSYHCVSSFGLIWSLSPLPWQHESAICCNLFRLPCRHPTMAPCANGSLFLSLFLNRTISKVPSGIVCLGRKKGRSTRSCLTSLDLTRWQRKDLWALDFSRNLFI